MSGKREGPSMDDIRRAAQAGAGVIRETPVLSSRTLSEEARATIALKAENSSGPARPTCAALWPRSPH